MGRRIKEPAGVHREAIAAAAERLFLHKGAAAATMDEVAKEAGYSKATLYVYFANKEELISFLMLKSMKTLRAFLHDAITQEGSVKEKYLRLCHALAGYQAQYPFYFTLALGEIRADIGRRDCPADEKETYDVGEQINAELLRFLQEGVKAGEFAQDLPVLQTVFLFWASLAGLIQMAVNKQSYLEKAMNLTREQFLEFGFERLYRLIAGENQS